MLPNLRTNNRKSVKPIMMKITKITLTFVIDAS